MITILGASGSTGSKIAIALINKGIKVRVVGRNEEKLQKLVSLGAEACVGDQKNVEFLTKAFTGADAAYALIPSPLDSNNVLESFLEAGKALIAAIKQSRLKKLVFLSSFGAEHAHGTGTIAALNAIEKMFSHIATTHVVFLRAGYFYENTLSEAHRIKHSNVYGTASDPQVPFFMVSSTDVAKKAVELLSTLSFRGQTIAEVFSDRLSHKQITDTIAKNIGLSSLPYVQFTGADSTASLVRTGSTNTYATTFVEFSVAHCKGFLRPIGLDPEIPNGEVTFDTFVKDVFVPAYDAIP